MEKDLGLRLIPVSLEEPEGLERFLLELEAGENGFSGSNFSPGDSLKSYLERLVEMAEGKNLAEGLVPMTTYWLVESSGSVQAIGRLRHRLTPRLLNDGGHIGYYVARSQRGKGLGNELLKLIIEAAHQLGISPLLLTVSSDNLASIRMIERNGGLLEDERIDETNIPYRRYWID